MQRKFKKPTPPKTFFSSNSGNAIACSRAPKEYRDIRPKMGSFYGPDPSAGPFNFDTNTAFD